jgi:hypothetical protein
MPIPVALDCPGWSLTAQPCVPTARHSSRHSSACTKTRCSSAQTMKHGPGRQLQSSSRCHRVSTRCTGAPHSWQGGEARAIRSALVMPSECPLTSSAPPLGCLSQPAPSFGAILVGTNGAARLRRLGEAVSRDRRPRPRRSLYARCPLALFSIESASALLRVSARCAVCAIDRLPIAGRTTCWRACDASLDSGSRRC